MVESCEVTGAKKNYDDISLLVLDPARLLEPGGFRVIMGGTSPFEEEAYQSRVLPQRILNRWLGVDEVSSNSSLMDSCGIKVL
jgi:hypothetical protein